MQQNNITAYVKDAVVILTFLAGIAGLYVKISEQIVRLESKMTILEAASTELKDANARIKILEEKATELRISNDRLAEKLEHLKASK